MKKYINKITILFTLLLFILSISNINYCTDLRNEIDNIDINSVNLNKINIDEVISYYEENLSQNYSNDELANIIEENSDILIKKGVNPDLISSGTTILRTTDSNEVINIIKNDLNIDEIKEDLGNNYTTEKLINKVKEQMTPHKSMKIALKLLFTNYVFRFCLCICLILFLYNIIVTWIIYRKAGQQGWASLIPIYKEAVLLKICKFSPWLLLLIFIPILGWFVLYIIFIITNFKLAEVFDKGPLFGLGLLLLPTLFKSILAFSSIKYIS